MICEETFLFVSQFFLFFVFLREILVLFWHPYKTVYFVFPPCKLQKGVGVGVSSRFVSAALLFRWYKAAKITRIWRDGGIFYVGHHNYPDDT